MRASFSVYKRPSHDRATGREVIRFCARFYDADHVLIKTTTLKSTNKVAAVLEAKALVDKGQGGTLDPLALDFLLDFWKPDSDYAKMKALRGKPLSLHYIEINHSVVKKHLTVPLKGVRLHGLTVDRMEKIVLDFAAKNMNPRSINFVIQTVHVPVADWARRHRVSDPLQYLGRAAEKPRERGTLNIEEIARIAALEGESPRVKAACLLGALCGLRMGEARGLEWGDVDEKARLLHIVHNWVHEREGVKGPKYGSARDVPLPLAVLEAVELCRAVAPAGSQFVLFNEKSLSKPVGKQSLERGFRHILTAIGISDDERKRRNLVFHGLRHTFISLERANGIPDFAVMRLAGHKTLAMTERYSHIDKVVDFAQARAALDNALAERKAANV